MSHLTAKYMVNAHKALESIGVPAELGALQNLSNGITWRLRNESMQDLAHIMSYFYSRRNDPVQKKLFQELCLVVERRWLEVEDADTFVSFLHYSECLSIQCLNHLDDRMTDLAGNMSPSDLAVVINSKFKHTVCGDPICLALSDLDQDGLQASSFSASAEGNRLSPAEAGQGDRYR